jgi:23S rRNA (cytosine1962-C5)-methyltransferase
MESSLSNHQEIFRNRLRKRYRHLRKWARRSGITCYRLYDRDIPEVPLVVDLYEGWLHLGEYHSPHKELPGTEEEYEQAMTSAAAEALDIPPTSVFYKRRRRMAATEHYSRQSADSVTAVVQEAGLSFEINLSDYIDVGLFLDHRPTRARVHDMVREYQNSGPVSVLNLFSYTGSFSVYAADAGARTTSVDLSKTYTAWAARNFALNGIDTSDHTLIDADVLTFLSEAKQKGRTFELIVVDPPTFSASKKTELTFSVQRDHGSLLSACEQLLTPGGAIVFSTNMRSFRLTELPETLRATDITDQTIPEDFRNRRIHYAWLLARSSE